jgi:hypothetical protein
MDYAWKIELRMVTRRAVSRPPEAVDNQHDYGQRRQDLIAEVDEKSGV